MLSPLKLASQLTGRMLKLQGYRWETRSWGELKLGIWRKGKTGTSVSMAGVRRLVIVPGFLDSPLSWLFILNLISPLIRRSYDEWILVDFPGFGGFLDRHRPFHSLDLLSSSIADLFDSLRPETLVGHSLGGFLCARYAAACGEGTRPLHQKKIYSGPKRLLLVDPVGLFAHPADRESFDRIFKTAVKHGFGELRPHIFRKEPRWFGVFAQELNQSILREEIGQFVHSVNEGHQLAQELPKIKSEAWVIWGDRDEIVPSNCAPIWVKGIGENARGIVLNRIGHTPHIESPVATSYLLGALLLGKKPGKGGKTWREI